jgi:hemerythrin-like domain-containing protein
VTTDQVTKGLRDEHQLILKVVAALEELLESPTLDLEVIEGCVSFFRLFVDACHHGQEEGLLFPELEATGMPREQGPIAVMLEEHRIGRALVGRMQDALPGIRDGDVDADAAFRDAARNYVYLIRGHIRKEDGVLFTHADHVLGGPACARLCDGFDEVCAGKFEGCTKAQLEDLADRILHR